MARNTGTFEFPSNFEVKKAAPLDARTQTGLKSELTGLPFPYKGMIVSVTDDTADSNGTYVLNATDGTLLSNWEKIASTTVSNLAFAGNLLTLTMSDGTSLTATITPAAASAPTGQTGSSTILTSRNGSAGTLGFSSDSGRN